MVLRYTDITIHLHFPARRTDLPSRCCECQSFCYIFEKQKHANFINKREYLSEKAFKMFNPPPPPQIFLCNNVEFLHTAIVLQLVTTVKKLILIQQQLTASFRADVQKTQLLSLYLLGKKQWVSEDRIISFSFSLCKSCLHKSYRGLRLSEDRT